MSVYRNKLPGVNEMKKNQHAKFSRKAAIEAIQKKAKAGGLKPVGPVNSKRVDGQLAYVQTVRDGFRWRDRVWAWSEGGKAYAE